MSLLWVTVASVIVRLRAAVTNSTEQCAAETNSLVQLKSSSPCDNPCEFKTWCTSYDCWPTQDELDALSFSVANLTSCGPPSLYPPMPTYYFNSAMCDHTPKIYVNVTNAQVAQRAVQFASKYNIRVIAKSFGHSFRGESAGDWSMMLWVRPLGGCQFPDWSTCGIHIDEDSTTCGETFGATLNVSGGVTWGEVYSWMNRSCPGSPSCGYSTVGGTCASVSASGGWVQGTGLSGQVTRSYGYGVDNVIEYEVVTPKGEHVRANKCTNKELFKVLKGGGAGAWGVLISTRYKLFSDSKFSMQIVAIPYGYGLKFFRVIAEYAVDMDHRLQISQMGLATPDSIAAQIFFKGGKADMVQTDFYQALAELNRTGELFFFVPQDGPNGPGSGGMDNLVLGGPIEWDGFSQMKIAVGCENCEYLDRSEDYRDGWVGARIVPRKAFRSKKSREFVAQVLYDISNFTWNPKMGFYHLGGAGYDIYKKQKDKQATYVSKEMREAIFLVQIVNETLNQEWLNGWAWTGTDLNHMYYLEPDWQQNGWGWSTYRELLKQKRDIDPQCLFHGRRSVGWMDDQHNEL